MKKFQKMKTLAQQGFTLIELMIVIAIIGILASIAVPSYQDYIARSQISEAITLLGGLKTPFAEFYQNRGRWPTGIGSVATGLQNGKYVASMEITGGSNDSGALRLGAVMSSDGVNPKIASVTVYLESTTGESWECGTTDENKLPFLPTSCTQLDELAADDGAEEGGGTPPQ